MNILPYKLATTQDQLTSRAGLLAIAQVMESINLSERIDKYFALPKSNRGFKPSVFIETLILMQHEGSFHLDDVRHINDDEALRAVLSPGKIPQAEDSENRIKELKLDFGGDTLPCSDFNANALCFLIYVWIWAVIFSTKILNDEQEHVNILSHRLTGPSPSQQLDVLSQMMPEMLKKFYLFN